MEENIRDRCRICKKKSCYGCKNYDWMGNLISWKRKNDKWKKNKYEIIELEISSEHK